MAVRNGTTRLAPSPTGALHLGNARTFLVNWAMARTRGWRIVLRIEDLDGPRIKPGAIEQTVDLLRWLGMDWDEGPIVQSKDYEPSVKAMRRLAAAGMVYPSDATRSEGLSEGQDASLSAPQEGVREAHHGADQRPAEAPREFAEVQRAWRFITPAGPVEVDDAFCGKQIVNPSESVGDFVVWTKRGTPAYQLAVVVDDARQGVTEVVRGDDLLDSAGRQMLLYEALRKAGHLGAEDATPRYWHLPLVRGADGRRLAKRHGDTRLDTYRAKGVRAERVIGLVGAWCGPDPANAPRREMSAEEFRRGLDLSTMCRGAITFTPEDDAWLLRRE